MAASSGLLFERAVVRRSGCGPPLRVAQRSAGGPGSVVWDAALVLARFLEKSAASDADADAASPGLGLGRLPLRRRAVLELGAGPGLVGLTAASLGYAQARLPAGRPPSPPPG